MSEQSISPLSKSVIVKDYADEFDGFDDGSDLGEFVEPEGQHTTPPETSSPAPSSPQVEPQQVEVMAGEDLSIEGDDLGMDGSFFESDQEMGEDGEGFEVSDEAGSLGSEWITDFIQTIGTSELPRILHNTTKISEAKIKIAEIEGLLAEDTLNDVKAINKNNEKALKDTIKDQMKMIEEPLKQVLKARNANVSPEVALVGAVVLASVVVFFQTREIKQQNDEFINKIFKKNNI
jgi:hypothetical protein